MIDSQQFKILHYECEVLRARLAIREHFIKTVVKEVYENIGQVLSLIRVQLSLVPNDFEAGKNEKLESSGELVGKTIRDLRGMCRLFYPEQNIISGAGFSQAFEFEIRSVFPNAKCFVCDEIDAPPIINQEKGLVLFGVLLEIIELIAKGNNAQLTEVALKYVQNKIDISINYIGDTITSRSKRIRHSPNLSLFKRAELIGGSLGIKNIRNDVRRIKLVIPIN